MTKTKTINLTPEDILFKQEQIMAWKLEVDKETLEVDRLQAILDKKIAERELRTKISEKKRIIKQHEKNIHVVEKMIRNKSQEVPDEPNQ